MSSVPLRFTRQLDASLERDVATSDLATDDIMSSKADLPRIMLATTCHLPSTARLALAFAEAGGAVFAVYPGSHPLDATRALTARYPYSARSPLRSLQSAIERAEPDVIIPCDERAVRHLHRLHAVSDNIAVRSSIERSLGDPAGYKAATTRHDLLMLARAQGVPVPDSATVSELDDLRQLAKARPFPWVVKADGSWAGFGVRIVQNLAEAEAAYVAMNQPVPLSLVMREALVERDYFWAHPWLHRSRPAISVQSFIVGRPANCAVACWRGEVLAGIAVEVVDAEYANGPSTVVRAVPGEQMLDAARKVVSALGISGMIGFDFMIEAATGVHYMIEMNPRNTPITHVNLGGDRDLAEAMLAQIAGRPPRMRPAVTEHDLIVFFPHTWQTNPNSIFLHTAYHDVPWHEPELVRELVQPESRERYWTMRMLRQVWLMAQRIRKGGK